jgi:serine/threonine protein kinase
VLRLQRCTWRRHSFGSILKATDKSTDEDVAVKIIKAKKSVIEQILFFKTSASVKQGRKEVSILTDLQHPNITAIRDHFNFRKSAFKSGLAIVMEYCPEGNLQTLVQAVSIRFRVHSSQRFCTQGFETSEYPYRA